MPWVSRAYHELKVEQMRFCYDSANSSAAIAYTALDAANRRYEELFAAYRQLRATGANPKDPDPVLPPRKVDPIQTAINRVTAGKDEKVRVAAWRQVDIDRKAGLKEDEIIARIHRGSRPAEDVQ